MSVTFYKFKDGEYESVGRMADGKIVEGEEELEGLYDPEDEGTDEEELVQRFDGPYFVASIDEEEAGE